MLIPAADFLARFLASLFQSSNHEIVIIRGYVSFERKVGENAMNFIDISEVGQICVPAQTRYVFFWMDIILLYCPKLGNAHQVGQVGQGIRILSCPLLRDLCSDADVIR